METMKKGVIRKASLPTRINPVGCYSTLILMFFPQLGQVMETLSFFGCSKSSVTGTHKASAILLRVSTVGFPLTIFERLTLLIPILSASHALFFDNIFNS